MPNVFLTIDGILGGSEDPRHRGAMEVTSFSFLGPGQAGIAGSGGGGAGKAKVDELSFTKRADKASHFLMVYSAQGRHFKDAVLTVEETGRGGNTTRSTIIKMTSILIKAARAIPGTVDDEAGLDEVVLSFADY